MKPSVAVTGNEYCPGGIEELVLTTNDETDEPPEGTGTLGGEKLEHVAPTGRVPQENVKVLEARPWESSVAVQAASCPGATEEEFGGT